MSDLRSHPAPALGPDPAGLTGPRDADTPLLTIDNLNIDVHGHNGRMRAVNNVSLQLYPGEMMGVVGEAGAGKSLTALAVPRLLPPQAAIVSGSIHLEGVGDLTTMSESQMRRVRGRDVAIVFQDPLSSLNPSLTVGAQLAQPLKRHTTLSNAGIKARVIDLLRRVGISEPETNAGRFPHEYSGGMRQRAALALALSCSPRLIIADEPTTGVDTILKVELLSLLKEISIQDGTAVLMITHDLGLIARYADRVTVMYAGQIVESARKDDLFQEVRHPYTLGLFQSVPRIGARREDWVGIPGVPATPGRVASGCGFEERCEFSVSGCSTLQIPLVTTGDGHRVRCTEHESVARTSSRPSVVTSRALSVSTRVPEPVESQPVIEVVDVSISYGTASRWRLPGRKAPHLAVRDASFAVQRNEIFALVGESGAGKSSLGRAVAGLTPISSGRILLNGQDTSALPGGRPELWSQVQMIFQDAMASFDPRMRVFDIVAEPLKRYCSLSSRQLSQEVGHMAELVGLTPDQLYRRPGTLSGGQRQRVGIARALACKPQVVVCDEPVSSLDVSAQARSMRVFEDIQREFGIALILISHDLAVVNLVADRIAVMRNGQVMETGVVEDVFARPETEYSKSLFQAAHTLQGD